MNGKFYMNKIHLIAFLICVCTVSMCMFSPVYAASAPLDSGVSGSCTWKYERINGDVVLIIAPMWGEEGTLGSFFWCYSQYRESAKYVVVKKTVKVESSAAGMFKHFKQAKSMDLSGLDMADATSTKEMFYSCESLISLDGSMWDVSNVRDMKFMFDCCEALVSLDVSRWDVSSVKHMQSLFHHCFALTSLDVSRWNVSSVIDMRFMFGDCTSLKLLNVSEWDVSRVIDMTGMFRGCCTLTLLDVSRWDVSEATTTELMFAYCSSLTVLDVSGWDVSKVTDMRCMFYECIALHSLDLSNWEAADEILMEDAFNRTRSLKQIFLGSNFHITDDAAFGYAGSQAGTQWMQVNLGRGGTHDNPKGRIFELSRDLLAFHYDRALRETDVEEYVRVAPAELTINFDKGADEANGEMASQVYDVGMTKTLSKNAYTRAGHIFTGWKDPEDNVYANKQTFRNNYFGHVVKNGKVPQRTLKLVAQWKAVLTYKARKNTHVNLSRFLEEADSSHGPRGAEVTAGVPEDKEVMWTVYDGGNDNAFFWSHKRAKLEGDAIKAAAQKNGKFLPTTFVVELVDKVYTITFDANVPFGTEVKGLPYPIVVQHGQEAQIPTGVTLSRPGYRFKGEWNDNKDGKGTSYRAGSKTGAVFSHKTLYAQWEKVTTPADPFDAQIFCSSSNM